MCGAADSVISKTRFRAIEENGLIEKMRVRTVITTIFLYIFCV